MITRIVELNRVPRNRPDRSINQSQKLKISPWFPGPEVEYASVVHNFYYWISSQDIEFADVVKVRCLCWFYAIKLFLCWKKFQFSIVHHSEAFDGVYQFDSRNRMVPNTILKVISYDYCITLKYYHSKTENHQTETSPKLKNLRSEINIADRAVINDKRLNSTVELTCIRCEIWFPSVCKSWLNLGLVDLLTVQFQQNFECYIKLFLWLASMISILESLIESIHQQFDPCSNQGF